MKTELAHANTPAVVRAWISQPPAWLEVGPDRLAKFPAVEEFDFYNARYLADDGEAAIPIEIEVTLCDLSEEVANKCAGHLDLIGLDLESPCDRDSIIALPRL